MMVASQWKMSSSALGPALHEVGGSFCRSCELVRRVAGLGKVCCRGEVLDVQFARSRPGETQAVPEGSTREPRCGIARRLFASEQTPALVCHPNFRKTAVTRLFGRDRVAKSGKIEKRDAPGAPW